MDSEAPATAAALRARLGPDWNLQPELYRVRIHRALSWLARSERETEDADARFIFLWIAFNAAYGHDYGEQEQERDQLARFFARLVEADGERRLHALLFDRFSGPIRTLIDNRHTFQPFWRALRDHDDSDAWRTRFAKAKQAALLALMQNDTAKLLGIVFDRLYVLRCSLVHGGATWNSRLNRPQVHDGVRLMERLVPAMLALMIEHPGLELGPISFPVQRE